MFLSDMRRPWRKRNVRIATRSCNKRARSRLIRILGEESEEKVVAGNPLKFHDHHSRRRVVKKKREGNEKKIETIDPIHLQLGLSSQTRRHNRNFSNRNFRSRDPGFFSFVPRGNEHFGQFRRVLRILIKDRELIIESSTTCGLVCYRSV